MKLIVCEVPKGLRTLDYVEADVFQMDDGILLKTNSDSTNFELEADYSLAIAFHYQLLKHIRIDRTRGVVLKLIYDRCEHSPKALIEIIWGPGATSRAYQSLSSILQSRLTSHARLPGLPSDS